MRESAQRCHGADMVRPGSLPRPIQMDQRLLGLRRQPLTIPGRMVTLPLRGG